MREKRRVVVSAVLVLASCAPAATQRMMSARPASGVVLTVTNDNWLDATVYAVRGTMRVRIGQATGNATTRLRIPRHVIVADEVQLMVDLIGSLERYTTDPISVARDQQVQLNVAPVVNMSSYALRLR